MTKKQNYTKLLRHESESLKALNDGILTRRSRQRNRTESLIKALNDGIYFNKTCEPMVDYYMTGSIDYFSIFSPQQSTIRPEMPDWSTLS